MLLPLYWLQEEIKGIENQKYTLCYSKYQYNSHNRHYMIQVEAKIRNFKFN